jgi:hypothetical protein
MDLTAVPKATIDEDRQLSIVEHKIGLPKELLVSSPSSHLTLAEDVDQTKLRRQITATSHLRHDFRALTLRKNI